MVQTDFTYRWIIALLLCFVPIAGASLFAQTANDSVDDIPKAMRRRMETEMKQKAAVDSVMRDSLQQINARNLEGQNKTIDSKELELRLDSASRRIKPMKPVFVPDSKKATWLSAIFPGGGQIYNRKFWKLPIIYGGFLGCAYALSWNSKYYSDYSQAYLDIMDDDPKTNSYLNFLPINYDVEGREEWLKEVFKNKRNTFRRQRDLSIFAFVGVYILSIIDAYVDAELSSFDISPNIGFNIEPAIFNDRDYKNNAFGLQCSLKFK